MEKYALVDLGSNTVRLSVYNIHENGKFETLFSKKEMAGLAGYIVDGKMSPDGINKACAVLLDFKVLLSQFNIDKMHVFATASLRNIQNTDEAVQIIKRRTGLEVDVVSGIEEGRLGYYGALYSTDLQNGYMFDIGGGSTEIVEIKNGEVIESQSLPMGSLNLFNTFVKKIMPKKSEITDIYNKIDKELSNCTISDIKDKKVCCVGGTSRAMLKIVNAYCKKEPENRIITKKDLDKTIEMLIQKDIKSRGYLLKLCPDRLHTILPGAFLMQSMYNKLGCDKAFVSLYGVREGYLCQKFLKNMI